MILLDTNYLIRLLVPGTSEALAVTQWIKERAELCTSAVCWYEFVCGPVNEEGVLLVASILHDRILPFSREQAAEASRLFNVCGRKRSLRVDAMIAAAAIVSQSALATENTADFSVFETQGLRLTT